MVANISCKHTVIIYFFYSFYKYSNSRYNVQSGTKSKTNCIDKAQEYYLHELDKQTEPNRTVLVRSC